MFLILKKYFKLYYIIAVDCYEEIRNCYIIRVIVKL